MRNDHLNNKGIEVNGYLKPICIEIKVIKVTSIKVSCISGNSSFCSDFVIAHKEKLEK